MGEKQGIRAKGINVELGFTGDELDSLEVSREMKRESRGVYDRTW